MAGKTQHHQSHAMFEAGHWAAFASLVSVQLPPEAPRSPSFWDCSWGETVSGKTHRAHRHTLARTRAQALK